MLYDPLGIASSWAAWLRASTPSIYPAEPALPAGTPIQIKINGTAQPVNPQVLTAEDAKKICFELLTPQQQERLEKERELNISFPIEGTGNFRVNMMWQKGSPAAVVRYITTNIPDMRTLGLPQVLAQLPKLPEELEYRFVRTNMILFDPHAHIIADYVPNAFK